MEYVRRSIQQNVCGHPLETDRSHINGVSVNENNERFMTFMKFFWTEQPIADIAYRRVVCRRGNTDELPCVYEFKAAPQWPQLKCATYIWREFFHVLVVANARACVCGSIVDGFHYCLSPASITETIQPCVHRKNLNGPSCSHHSTRNIVRVLVWWHRVHMIDYHKDTFTQVIEQLCIHFFFLFACSLPLLFLSILPSTFCSILEL